MFRLCARVRVLPNVQRKCHVQDADGGWFGTDDLLRSGARRKGQARQTADRAGEAFRAASGYVAPRRAADLVANLLMDQSLPLAEFVLGASAVTAAGRGTACAALISQRRAHIRFQLVRVLRT